MVVVGLPYSFQGQVGRRGGQGRHALRRQHDRGRRRVASAERRRAGGRPFPGPSRRGNRRQAGAGLRSQEKRLGLLRAWKGKGHLGAEKAFVINKRTSAKSVPLPAKNSAPSARARRPGRGGRGSPRRGPPRDRRDRDGRGPRRVEVAQGAEQAGRRLGGIARRATGRDGPRRSCPAGAPGPNSSTASPGCDPRRVQAHAARAARNARRACRGRPAGRPPPRPEPPGVAEHRPDRRPRDAAGPQQPRRAAEAGHDRRFDAHRRVAAVEHGVDPAVEVGERHGRPAVGLTRPERLAEGAATGRPAAARSACASGWAGTRRATLAGRRGRGRRPACAGCAGTTRVSGPGQKASRERGAPRVEDAPPPAPPPRSARCAISGLKRGRALRRVEPATARGVGARPRRARRPSRSGRRRGARPAAARRPPRSRPRRGRAAGSRPGR